MTSSHREPRLPERAEEMLEGWPAPTRGALEWEESANTIMNRVGVTRIGSTPDGVLEAPLPEEPDERGREAPRAAPSEAPPGEPSLAEIARAAVSAAQAETREVAREGLLAAELGRKSPPREVAPAPRELVDAASLQGRIVRVPDPAPVPQDRPPPPPKIAKHEAPAANAVAEAMAHSEVPAPPSHERRHPGGAVVVGSLLALAAAVSLFVSFGHHSASVAKVSASAEQPTAVAKNEPEAPKAITAVEPSALPSASARERGVAKDDELALAEPVAQPSPASAPAAVASKEKALAFHVKKESAPNAGKLVLEEQQEAPTQNGVASLHGSTNAGVGVSAMPASERPSTGAIQAALGSVLTSARGCLAGQDAGARALVTFEGRTGHVKSVKVVGAEPGSPAESCVRAALMGARLPPFSDPDFTASITVRPL
jgi:hypothetical protein